MIRQDLKAALETGALAWLRFNQQCVLITKERWRLPEFIHGRPDICGVTHEGKVIEIEIKMSRSDFKADAKKPKYRYHNQDRDQVWKHYYLGPKELVQWIHENLNQESPWGILKTAGFSWAGDEYPCLDILRSCRANRKATKLSNAQILGMAKDQCSTLIKAESVNARLRNQIRRLTQQKAVEH